jgi:Spy/CpxP family protein refolding chaperone
MIVRVLAAVLVCLAATARAESPTDAVAAKLFPPELLMAHQQELGIDERQRETIVKEVQALQARVVEIQWQMHAAVSELVKLLDAARVDEARALAQADKVMGLERDVKRTHLGMLIRIRNLLTDAQRAKAAALRAGAR